MSNTLSLRASKLFDLTSKVACVTGGGTGIGLMAAQALAAQGARVYIAGRRMELLEQAVKVHGSKEALGDSGGSLIPLQADITSKESIKNLVKTIEEKDKILHILVNNSGISGETVKTAAGDESAEKLAKELDEDTFDGWNEVYKTNVAGHYFTSAACLPLLSKATKESGGEKWGNIINITSISGITSNAQNHFSYNATKAAAIHLTNMMATEFSRDGVKVRVNSIAPGYFPSEMTTNESDENNKSEIKAGSSYGKDKGVPIGRPGKDEDMAQAVLFLACNQYVSGQTIPVDGGFLLHHPS